MYLKLIKFLKNLKKNENWKIKNWLIKKKDNIINIYLYILDNKHVILNDIEIICLNLKELNLIEIFLFFIVFLPINFFFISIYLFITIFFFIILFFNFIFKYIIKYIFKKKQVKHIERTSKKNRKTTFSNYIVLFILIIFLKIPQNYSFYYFYNYLKLFKIDKKKIIRKELILVFIRLLVRLLFMFLFSYSIFVLKISSEIFKIIKEAKTEKYDCFKTFIQVIFFRISEVYYSYSYKIIKGKKIKFLKNGLKLNKKPEEKLVKKALEYSKEIFNINSSEERIFKNAFDTITKKTYIKYCKFESIKIINKKEIIIQEEKPHVTFFINTGQKEIEALRESKSKNILLGDKSFMQTHTKAKGTINEDLVVYKTNFISIDKEDIRNIFNEKLQKNLFLNPEIMNIYKLAVINSLEQNCYKWKNGSINLNNEYTNFLNKIDNDKNLNKDLKLKEGLNNISKIYKNNIKEEKNVLNDKLFNSALKIILSDTNNIDYNTANFVIKTIEDTQ